MLAIHVRFPFAKRLWALLVLTALYKPEELNKQDGRRHRTLIDLAQGRVATLVRWFPTREFILLGDGGYASHDLARFAHRHRRHLTLVSRFHAGANLYAPPPKRKGKKGGGGLLPVRWVFVHDLDSTHRDESFYSTDPDLTPEQIVSLFTARGSIEVTFQQIRGGTDKGS